MDGKILKLTLAEFIQDTFKTLLDIASGIISIGFKHPPYGDNFSTNCVGD